jgi:hypothetical protein
MPGRAGGRDLSRRRRQGVGVFKTGTQRRDGTSSRCVSEQNWVRRPPCPHHAENECRNARSPPCLAGAASDRLSPPGDDAAAQQPYSECDNDCDKQKFDHRYPCMPDDPSCAIPKQRTRRRFSGAHQLRVHGQRLQKTRHQIVAPDGRREFDDFTPAEMGPQRIEHHFRERECPASWHQCEAASAPRNPASGRACRSAPGSASAAHAPGIRALSSDPQDHQFPVARTLRIACQPAFSHRRIEQHAEIQHPAVNRQGTAGLLFSSPSREPSEKLRNLNRSVHGPAGIQKLVVGVRGFEPPTPASRTQYSTRLSYTPNSTASNPQIQTTRARCTCPFGQCVRVTANDANCSKESRYCVGGITASAAHAAWLPPRPGRRA